jgi:ABC-type thiamin/hydroxymethylpyrimidine transport system permease subunit
MTRSHRTGLALLGVVSLLDVLGPLASDGEHPPMWVALIGLALGAASLACIVAAWRGERRALLPLVVLRLASMLTAVPAFFVDDVPSGIVAFAAGFILVSLVGVALVSGSRARVAVTA